MPGGHPQRRDGRDPAQPNGRARAGASISSWCPAADGTTRIDDVLFATRRSDTLRARLTAYAAAR